MDFLILIPSVRQSLPEFEDVMAEIKGSLTRETDTLVLDGSSGKAQTLNRALEEIVRPSKRSIVVTLDDDTIPPVGWQDALVAGFEKVPKAGILSIWLGEEPDMLQYMNAEQNVLPPETIAGLKVRRIREEQMIPGALLAIRRNLALDIGQTPTGKERYQYYEDAFRCLRAWKLGYSLAYVEMDQPLRMIEYKDPEEYLAMKSADVASARDNLESYLNEESLNRALPLNSHIVKTRLRRMYGALKSRLYRILKG
jgi:hypothetical protein